MALDKQTLKNMSQTGMVITEELFHEMIEASHNERTLHLVHNVISDDGDFVENPGEMGWQFIVFRTGNVFKFYFAGLNTTRISIPNNKWIKLVDVEDFPELSQYQNDALRLKAWLENEYSDTEAAYGIRARIDAQGIWIRGKEATTTVGTIGTHSLSLTDTLILEPVIEDIPIG